MLIEQTWRGHERMGLSGPDRALVYTPAVGTGLRVNEIRTLTPTSFDLEATPPIVTVSAAYSKHRRDDALPLRSDLISELHPHPDRFAPGQTVFRLPDRPAKMLRADLAAAVHPSARPSP